MKIKIIFLFILALVFNANSVDAQKKRPVPKSKVLSAREIAAKVLPSVVLIITQDENGIPISQGSGFVYRPGLVVSNLHVFERASNAIVKDVKTGKISRALEVVGMNAKQDICIIRIDDRNFPSVVIGDSWNVQTGDEIYVASNPKGLEGSFTKGIVSSVREKGRLQAPKGRENEYEKIARDLWTLDDRTLFQIDAAISPGSSGGVLVNSKAEAIGIIKSSVVSGQNLNFAIPIEQLTAVSLKFKHSIQLAGACAYSDREKENLKGLVKELVEKSPHRRVVNGQLIDDGIQVDAIVSYDIDGNEVSRTILDMNDRSRGIKISYTYDENRLKTGYTEGLIGSKGKYTPFDFADGIYNKLYGRHFSGSMGSVDDQSGMLVFNSSGQKTEWFIGKKRIEYKYGSDGNVIESTQWGNGRIEIRHRFRYKKDKFGNWVEKYEESNYPTSTSPSVYPDEWLEGETEYREISYYD
ncbi:MAG: serine protease [Acidobacteria bacterium]|nr:serine protease [Acidobacteriota bacterium]MCW5949623.1 serine protease [Pyrinomonadaceae bacterium]